MDAKTNNSYSDELEIDLGEVLLLLWHYLWLIVLCAVVAGAAAFCFCKFAITPMYQSTTQVYVISKNDSNSSLTYNDLQIGTQLTKDYPQIIKSRNVLEAVIVNLGLNDTYNTLQKRVTVTTPTDGRILAITVEDASPILAQSIADEIRDVSSEHIRNVTDIEAMNVVDYANLPTAPSSPSLKKWTALGLLVGAFLCIAVLLIRFLLDDTVKNSEDVEKFLGLSTLAIIPLVDEQEAQKEKTRQDKIIKSSEEAGVVEKQPEPERAAQSTKAEKSRSEQNSRKDQKKEASAEKSSEE